MMYRVHHGTQFVLDALVYRQPMQLTHGNTFYVFEQSGYARSLNGPYDRYHNDLYTKNRQ